MNNKSVTLEIIIITRDRHEDLNQCLTSISDYSSNVKNIIVVDSSTDSVTKVKNLQCINHFSNKIKIDYSHYELEIGTLPIARNIGLSKATADYVMFIDDDAFIGKTTLHNMVELIGKVENIHVFGCRIIQGNEVLLNIAIKQLSYPIYSLIKWSTGNFNIVGSGYLKVGHMQGTCMCFRRNTLLEAGGFNENLCSGYASFEDTEATTRVARFSKTPIYLTLDSFIVHGMSPRINGIPRDIGLNIDFAYSYGKNGTITSRVNYGLLFTLLAAPLVTIYQSLKIAKRFFVDRKFKRFNCLFYFIKGQINGLSIKVVGVNDGLIKFEKK
jgi:GT2 family glycosyltransferase